MNLCLGLIASLEWGEMALLVECSCFLACFIFSDIVLLRALLYLVGLHVHCIVATYGGLGCCFTHAACGREKRALISSACRYEWGGHITSADPAYQVSSNKVATDWDGLAER